MLSRAAKIYRNVSIDSASPTRTLDETYSRLIAECRTAADRIAQRDLAGKGMAISRCLGLVGALAAALDHKAAPELCANLGRLYQFIRDKLVEANFKVNAKPLDDVTRIVTSVRETFQLAADNP